MIEHTLEHARVVEEMVSAILAESAIKQAQVVEGLTEGEEQYVRAGASILAGIFTAMGKQYMKSPSKLWRMHLEGTEESRRNRLAHDGETQRR